MRQNNHNENFNGRIKRIEADNSNLFNLTIPNCEIPIKKPFKIFSNLNKIFFIDYQQKNERFEKINDFELYHLKKEVEKEFNEGKFVLKNYCQNYIEENVLPILKKNNLNNEQFNVWKYNIEKILESFGLPKDYYLDDIYQYNIKKYKVDRKKSIDALRKFRKEFYNFQLLLNKN